MRSSEGIVLNKKKYALELIDDVGLGEVKPTNAPLEQNQKLTSIKYDESVQMRASGDELIIDVAVYQRVLERLFCLAKNKVSTVEESLSNSGTGSVKWKGWFFRPLLDREKEMCKILADRLIGTVLISDKEDRLCWSNDKLGVFLVKKCSELLILEDESDINFDCGKVWNIKDKAGCGGILRDFEGMARGIFSGAAGTNVTEEAEIEAVKIALEVFESTSWKCFNSLIIEVGSAVVFSWCNNKGLRPWSLQAIFSEIESTKCKAGSIVFSLVDRNGNDLTFSLALAGVNMT
ncbi:hypothetical protein PVK06_038086 [Gossypium arboreum]|uniref:RNase H type-1 domain-containing protein n=1 Tax=Gossypium arboreum TaxID=29729 RepID=A0ABR0MZ41_GOSAR|nr:hypothetical protein PVK06_038086 [Gossypium arboreum]